MQVFGWHIPALSMTLNREDKFAAFERSTWSEVDFFEDIKDSIDKQVLSNLDKDSSDNLQKKISNNCLNLVSCQQQKVEKKITLFSSLDLIESFKVFKLSSDTSDGIGTGFVPILARSELGDIYKGVYDYDINLDKNSSSNTLILSNSSKSLKFFVSPRKSSYSNVKKTNWNSFKTEVAFKYDSLGVIKKLVKEKQSKANNKTASLKPLPANYSSLKVKINNYSSKQNYDESRNHEFAKPLPKYQMSYSVTDFYRSQEPLWQQQIDRKLEFKKQQLANQQRQFRIKMEQTIEQNYREQQRQQENLTQRTTQELRQELVKQQQLQLQPIRNYY